MAENQKLNSTGKVIVAMGYAAAVAYIGLLRLFGEDLGINYKLTGVVPFVGFILIVITAYILANKFGSDPAE